MSPHTLPGARRPARHRRLVAALVLATAGPLVACGGDDGGTTVSDVWARPTAEGADNAAFYLTIANDAGEAEVVDGASADVCDRTELHNSSMAEDGTMTMGAANVEDLIVPAGGELVFEPGGLHVMCIGVSAPLVEGDEIPLTIELSKTGTVELTAVVEQRGS